MSSCQKDHVFLSKDHVFLSKDHVFTSGHKKKVSKVD